MKDKAQDQIRVVGKLLQIGAYLQKTGNRITGEFGLTQQQFVVLNEVMEKGAVNQKQIVGELLLEKSNVSKIAKKLHSAGFIRISKSDEDGRTTVLSITEKGRRLWDACMQAFNRWAAKWLEGMSAEDLDRSLATLNQLKGLMHS